MEILLDTANTTTIEKLLPFFPISGFTTNPSILSKESDDVSGTLLRLRELSEGMRSIHVQVTTSAAEDMLAQAKRLRDFLGGTFYAKLPITREGLRAVKLCKQSGIHVTVTAIFTPTQALLAGMAGADYVAPYVDRLDNITSNGVTVVREIVELFRIHNLSSKVLAASFKNVQQVYDVASMGAQASTISGELCARMLFHPYTDKSIEDFNTDWHEKFGDMSITDFLT